MRDPVGRPAGRHAPPTYADLLQRATQRLADALGLERREARIEARALLAHALGVEHAWLLAHDREPAEPAPRRAIEVLLARRERGEPVAYILGEREFFGHVFRVTADVLIPRPDTELLVQAALDRLPADAAARVLDLGTGSGAVAIAIGLARPRAAVVAVDISAEALRVARGNAARLGAANVRGVAGDWFAADLLVKNFDIVVANPPYLADDDPHLALGDLRFEPPGALRAGIDGLAALRAIIAGATAHLLPGGWLLLEHGAEQGAATRALLARRDFVEIATWPDLAGLERVTAGRCPPRC